MADKKGFARDRKSGTDNSNNQEVEMFKFLAYYYGILFFLKAFGIGETDSSNNQGGRND